MRKFRYIILTKKTCICAFMLAVSLVFGVYSVVNWDKTLTVAGADKKLPIYCVNTPDKKISLSFDAAWGNTKKVQNLYKARKTRENKPFSVSFSVL